MKTSIKIFRPDGTVEERDVSQLFPPMTQPGNRELRDLLMPIFNGGHMQHVTVLHNAQRADMFVDEDGHAKGLPHNEAATAIYRNNWLTHHPEDKPESLPFVVGSAVLFSRRVWF